MGDGAAIGTDIVLLLDMSSSMNTNDVVGNLIIAVNNYLEKVKEQSANGVPNRVSIIIFSGTGKTAEMSPTLALNTFGDGSASDTSLMTSVPNVTRLEAKVSTLLTCQSNTSAQCLSTPVSNPNPYRAPGKNTQTGDGVKAAYDEMSSKSLEDQAKQVVLFTDGVPGADDHDKWSDAGCSTAGTCAQVADPQHQADTAIQYAAKLKSELNVTVNTVAMIQNSTWDTADFTADTTWTTASLDAKANVDQNAFTKRFMELVSSNVTFSGDPSAASMDSQKGTDWTLNTSDDSGANGVAHFASTPGELKDIFSNMIPKVDQAGAALDAKAVAAIYPSADFTLPTDSSGAVDTSTIAVYEEKVASLDSDTGEPTFTGNIVPATGVTISAATDADGNAGFSLTGWDYTKKYVGTHTDASLGLGSRLIIRYTQKATRAADTSAQISVTSASSSISEGTLSATYTSPTVQLTALADNTWIPDCTSVSDGLCLGKSAVLGSDKKTVTITLSAYATGSVVGGADTPSNSEVTAQSQIDDFATAYFSTTAVPNDVSVWEQDASEIGSDGTVYFDKAATRITQDVDYKITAATDKGDDGYVLSGWNIAQNYVGEHTDSATTANYGKRIVIQFSETVKSAFLGGNGVPTNVAAISGVTSDTASGTGADYVGTFPIKTVNIPLNKLTLGDAKAYETGNYDVAKVVRTATGAALTSDPSPDGSLMNDYVDIALTFMKKPDDPKYDSEVFMIWNLPHGASGGTYTNISTNPNATQAGALNVEVSAMGQISSLNQVSADSPDAKNNVSVLTLTDSAAATVYTLTPHVSVKDSAAALGTSVSLSGNVVNWKWWNTEKDSDLSNLPLASEKVTGRSGDGSAADVAISCVQGDCPADGSDKLAITTSSDFGINSVLLRAGSGDTARETEATAPDGVAVSNDRTAVSADDQAAAIKAEGATVPAAGSDFTIYALGSTVSSLPLTGAAGTGRWLLGLGLGFAIVAAIATSAYIVAKKSRIAR